jgi:alkanesulfonate monooxygenase SsuD/methylene tetrahydromethanopterin reductase-like flavin-dependent oxidoreductase (luciferase family)
MALCAPTQAEAEHHAASLRLSRLNLARGVPEGIPPPEEALAYAYSPAELDYLARSTTPAAVGDPSRVLSQLQELAAAYRTAELGIVTLCFDPAARLRSYELIAAAVGMS